MTCHRGNRLDAYLDGELDLAGALEVEEHLQSCTHCSALLGRLTGLRTALRRGAPLEKAPGPLRNRLMTRLEAPVPRAGLSWRWGLALAAPGCAALLLALWLAVWGPAPATAPSHEAARVVYHISNSATAGAALRTLSNHLNASPEVKVVVVAHNEGVDFLLRGALDESGQPFELAVRRFLDRGVEFRVCYNTLERRRIGAREVIPAASLVPSGIAEIGRLQTKEGYSYMRL
jgi:hypothetical protein